MIRIREWIEQQAHVILTMNIKAPRHVTFEEEEWL